MRPLTLSGIPVFVFKSLPNWYYSITDFVCQLLGYLLSYYEGCKMKDNDIASCPLFEHDVSTGPAPLDRKSGEYTDQFMYDLWTRLHLDFSALYPLPSVPKDIATIRSYYVPGKLLDRTPVALTKRGIQLEKFFKRYISLRDQAEPGRLELLDLQKTEAEFTRLNGIQEGFDHPLIKPVLNTARQLLMDLLGPPPVDLLAYGRYGKRANVGVSYKDSYLDVKMGKPITGSGEHLSLFVKNLRDDTLLRSAVMDARYARRADMELIHKFHVSAEGEITTREEFDPTPCYRVTSLLRQTVPKAWDSLRSIAPDTVSGSFITNAIGAYIEERLLLEGLDISRLQRIHGMLARQFSITRTHVTADLRNASGSITVPLIDRMTDIEWNATLNIGRVPRTSFRCIPGHTRHAFEGAAIVTPTFADMGIGFTFPLQTAVFYCLLRAIEVHAGTKKGIISVYGDDLIYPKALHRYVSVIFPLIGLQINQDKTFVHEHFRESCGADYFFGTNVRPFSIQERAGDPNMNHIAFMYKTINGLLNRWKIADVSAAVHYLLCRISCLSGEVLVVPDNSGDDSGLRLTPDVIETFFWCELGTIINPSYWYIPFSLPVLHRRASSSPKPGTHYLRYRAWTCVRLYRPVLTELPYYWEKLRSMNFRQAPHRWDNPIDAPVVVLRRIRKEDPALTACVPYKVNPRFKVEVKTIPLWA